MGAAGDGADAARSFQIDIGATPAAVREALGRVRSWLAGLGIGPESASTAELILAEVLNNVVEHAYGAGDRGPIRLTLWPGANTVQCQIEDQGAPLPEGQMPVGGPVDADCPRDALPEGGFGWFLIRSLAHDLDYESTEGSNCLRFRLTVACAQAMA